MDDLSAWLLERLAERERLADRMDESSMHGVESSDEEAWHEAADSDWLRVDCESKRRIIELHSPRGGYRPPDDWYGDQNKCQSCGGYETVAGLGDRGSRSSWPCQTLRVLALPYAGRPGYQESWRP